MLDEMLDFLEGHSSRHKCVLSSCHLCTPQHSTQLPHVCRGFTYELVIVNDGSKDGTRAVVMEYVDRYGSDIVRFCDLHKNHGKGGAVRKVSAQTPVQCVMTDVPHLTCTCRVRCARGVSSF